MHDNNDIMQSGAKWRIARSPSHANRMTRATSFDSFLMIENAAQKRQRTIDDMLCAFELGTKKMELREEDQAMEVVHVNEPAVSVYLSPQVVQTKSKAREAM